MLAVSVNEKVLQIVTARGLSLLKYKVGHINAEWVFIFPAAVIRVRFINNRYSWYYTHKGLDILNSPHPMAYTLSLLIRKRSYSLIETIAIGEYRTTEWRTHCC